MNNGPIALMIFGEPGSAKNALTEEKYKKLAIHFKEREFEVDSVLYHDSISGKLAKELSKYKAILVWVNPVEQGYDRKKLDVLLTELATNGCFVSAHPETILKLGTKEILHRVKETEFGGDIKLYRSFEDFKANFFSLKELTGIRILKPYRGNGGNGVFKIDATGYKNNRIGITQAKGGGEEILAVDDFFAAVEPYFPTNDMLIDQEWNQNIINGMVRCYLTGAKVTGFGYQEVNALYPKKSPSQRYYFSEDCGLFRDLKNIMENKWVPQLQQITRIESEGLPVIWDADFFINSVNTNDTGKKYSLCEINTSSVSPFPESSIPHIVEEVRTRLRL
ncbi:MAG TPA: Cj0069 family protein [Chitinophagaceae bacterium]|jgi:hypothetical protein|nr:Cj0069 family protein [Chitinophagaceae bacterium]